MASLLGAAKNLIDIVLLALFDVIRFPEYFGWVRGHSVLADSVKFE